MSVEREQLREAFEVLWEYPGATIGERVRSIVERVDYLRRELQISKYNESAAHAVIQQDQATLLATRSKLRYARIFLADVPNVPRWLLVDDSTQGDAHEQKARQAKRSEGAL